MQIVLVVIVGGSGLTSGACSQALLYGFGVGSYVQRGLLALMLIFDRESPLPYLYLLP